MDLTELKRKLRRLKKLETQIRFGHLKRAPMERLVWNEYFSTKDGEAAVKYGMEKLLRMDRQAQKEVFDEYFCSVYFRFYKDNGITDPGIYDPNLLAKFGLPPDSSQDEVKKKFRELAKKHHPDLGGDSGKFIEIFHTYQKLIGDQ